MERVQFFIPLTLVQIKIILRETSQINNSKVRTLRHIRPSIVGSNCGGYQNYTRGTGCFDTGKAGADQHTSLYATFNVPYQEGKLEAKAFDEKGNEITDTDGRRIVETTKNASRLAAEADRTEIKADGKDLSYITIDVLDQDGKFVNGAEPEIIPATDPYTTNSSSDGRLSQVTLFDSEATMACRMIQAAMEIRQRRLEKANFWQSYSLRKRREPLR